MLNSNVINFAIPFIKRIRYSNKILTIAFMLFLPCFVEVGNAVNLSISNISLSALKKSVGSKGMDKYKIINFDLSWDQSWHNGKNWDSAWIFIKFRIDGGTWKHASLNHVNSRASYDGGIESTGVTIKASSDEKRGCSRI